jgi:hypothetical protein
VTVGPESQCGTCIRYRSPFSRTNGDFSGGPFCAAFPAGIPDEVFDMGMDHRQPITGDHGLQWESNGEPYPERSLATA